MFLEGLHKNRVRNRWYQESVATCHSDMSSSYNSVVLREKRKQHVAVPNKLTRCVALWVPNLRKPMSDSQLRDPHLAGFPWHSWSPSHQHLPRHGLIQRPPQPRQAASRRRRRRWSSAGRGLHGEGPPMGASAGSGSDQRFWANQKSTGVVRFALPRSAGGTTRVGTCGGLVHS